MICCCLAADKPVGRPMLKLCGISIPASSVLEREKELEVLAKCIPSDPQARKRYGCVDVYIVLMLVL